MNGFEITAVSIIIVLGIIVIIQMIAITALLFVLKNLAQQIREHIDPLLTKANTLLITVNDIAQTVQGKTERISETTAHTAEVVADRVQKTSGLLQRLIAAPLIAGAAAGRGMISGVQAWRTMRHVRRSQ